MPLSHNRRSLRSEVQLGGGTTILCTLWTTPLITTVRNLNAQNRLRMPIVQKSEAEIAINSNLPSDAQGNGLFSTDLQGRKRTSGGDPRTLTFHQTWVTKGDTACSVKGV